MVGKRGITPIIATILLIVMTIGIAAFVFLWMQGFFGTLKTETEKQTEALRTPKFQMIYGYYDNVANTINITLVNQGDIPIDLSTSDATIVIEQYSKLNNSLIRTYSKTGSSSVIYYKTSGNDCKLNPNQQAECAIDPSKLNLNNINLTNNYYNIKIIYRGATTSYMLR